MLLFSRLQLTWKSIHTHTHIYIYSNFQFWTSAEGSHIIYMATQLCTWQTWLRFRCDATIWTREAAWLSDGEACFGFPVLYVCLPCSVSSSKLYLIFSDSFPRICWMMFQSVSHFDGQKTKTQVTLAQKRKRNKVSHSKVWPGTFLSICFDQE